MHVQQRDVFYCNQLTNGICMEYMARSMDTTSENNAACTVEIPAMWAG